MGTTEMRLHQACELLISFIWEQIASEQARRITTSAPEIPAIVDQKPAVSDGHDIAADGEDHTCNQASSQSEQH